MAAAGKVMHANVKGRKHATSWAGRVDESVPPPRAPTRLAFQAAAKALHLGLRMTGHAAQVCGQVGQTLLPKKTTPQCTGTVASSVQHTASSTLHRQCDSLQHTNMCL